MGWLDGFDNPKSTRVTTLPWESVQISQELCIKRVSGAAPKAALICLHGWSLDHRSFERQIPLAQYGIDIISFDRRGFGQNMLTPNPDLDLSDVHQIVLSTAVPAILYGVSQGARLALRYAQAYESHLSGLVFQGGLADSCVFDPTSQDEPPLALYQSMAEQKQLQDLRDHWCDHALMSRGLSPADKSVMRQHLESYDATDLLTPPSPSIFPSEKSRRAQLKLPMLVAIAEQDSTQRKFHAESLIQDCNATPLRSRGGHLFNFSHPQDFNEGFLSWIRSLGL